MNRSEMRRCGKRYGTEEDALRSKAGQRPGAEVHPCRCGGVHLSFPPEPRAGGGNPRKTVGGGNPRKTVGGNTIPPKVCAQVDKRDGRQCVKCGSRSGLHRHHRRLKGHGGDPRPHTDCACNLVLLCSTCHYWAHVLDRRSAEAEGLILPRNTLEPWREGVMVHSDADSGVTSYPACDGEYLDEAPIGVAA